MALAGSLSAATIATGASHSVAVRSDGTAFAWGYNNAGQLGNGYTNHSYVPIKSIYVSNAVAVAAGQSFTLLLKSDKTLTAWGSNDYGQLGTANTNDSNIPVVVQVISGVQAIAAGRYHSVALTTTGEVFAWGGNGSGQLGNGDTQTRTIPQRVSSLGSGVVAIAAGGDTSYALKSDGTVWAWGSNSSGQLGQSGTSTSKVPVQVTGATGVKAIAAGGGFAVALRNDATVLTWGYNNYCQLGNSVDRYGSCQNSAAANPVANFSNIAAIAASANNSVFLKSDGTVWTAGIHNAGQLGNNAESSYNKVSIVPVQVTGALAGKTVTEIAAHSAGDHFLARDGSSAVFAWGYDQYGQNGDNNAGYFSGTYTNYFNRQSVQVLGVGGDGYLGLAAGSNGCQSALTQASASIQMSVPCLSFNGANYSASFQYDPAVTNAGGTYFKLIGAVPK